MSQPKLVKDFIDLGPYETALPEELVYLIEGFIVGSGKEIGLQRLDASRLLVESWQEQLEGQHQRLPLDGSAPIYVRKQSDGSFLLGEVNEGSDGIIEAATIPAPLLRGVASVFQDEKASQSLVKLEDLSYLLSRWEDLLIDIEKLLGHLCLSHSYKDVDLLLSHSHLELTKLHGRLHQKGNSEDCEPPRD